LAELIKGLGTATASIFSRLFFRIVNSFYAFNRRF